MPPLSVSFLLLSILELVMGFPASYSELPSILLYAFFLLGFVRRLISWAFDSIGLGDLLDSDAPSADPNVQIYTHHHHHRSTLAVQVEEAMPAVQFAALGRETEGCAVCLHEFEGAAEVRRPSNCCHVFHRACLDPWIEQGQRTCPLCRAAIFPAELKLSLNGAAGSGDGIISDTFFADYPSSPSLPAPILPHHFFSF